MLEVVGTAEGVLDVVGRAEEEEERVEMRMPDGVELVSSGSSIMTGGGRVGMVGGVGVGRMTIGGSSMMTGGSGVGLGLPGKMGGNGSVKIGKSN